MSDERISDRIERLVGEEHELRNLLRQRRALRDAGENPQAAKARDPNTVERYWQ